MGNADQIAALTDKQRECLRMVLTHHSSKEIARELGISVDAVDQRIKGAMRRLGVASRTEAARLLARHEGFGNDGPAHHSAPSARKKSRFRPNTLSRFYPRSKRSRFTLWSCLAAFILAFLGLGDVVDFWIHHERLGAPTVKASGDIVLITVDQKTVDKLGPIPFPRRHFARLIDQLEQMGVQRVLPLFFFDLPSQPADDRALAESFHPLRTRLLLPIAFVRSHDGGLMPSLPLPEFRKYATPVHIGAFKGAGYFFRFEGARPVAGQTVPAGVSALANEFPVLDSFPIDYSIDAATIPSLSAIDIMEGNVSPQAIKGKDVVIAAHGRIASENIYRVPGRGHLSAGQLAVMAAETYRNGFPFETNWFGEYLLGLLVVGLSCFARNQLRATAVLLTGAAAITCLAYSVEPNLFIGVANPLFLILLVAAGTSWLSFRHWYRLRRQVPA